MASKEDVQRLKRLVRETFEELVSLKTRLREVEKTNDTESLAPPPGAGVLKAAGSRNRAQGVQLLKAAQIRGAVDVVGGVSWEKRHDPNGTQMPVARLRVALLLPFAEGLGSVLAEIANRQPDSMMCLRKVLVQRQWPSTGFKATLAALGAKCQDIIPTLNPHAEQGLSRVICHGSGLHQECGGEGLGFSWTREGLIASAAYLSNKGHPRRLLRSTIGQIVMSPSKRLSLGVVGVLHTPQVLLRVSESNSNSNNQRHESLASTSDPLLIGDNELLQPPVFSASAPSTGVLKMGATGALNISDEVLISGWVSGDAISSRDQDGRVNSWGACISSYPYPHTVTWRAGLGRSVERDCPMTTIEASLQIDGGSGVHVFPGLILQRKADGWSSLVGARTLWTF